MQKIVLIGLVALLTAVVCPTYAQTSRAIRIVVPVPAGGPSDAAARVVAQALGRNSSQSYVIDNRPGANGAIAAQQVLSSQPDGRTLLWGLASMTALPLLQSNSPYQSIAEFTPVTIIGRFAYALFVHPSVPVRSLQELVKYARDNPQKLSIGTGTIGEFMTAAQFGKATHTSLLRVPYKGGAQVLQDLLAGRVQTYITPIQLAYQYVRDGKLRALAVIGDKRTSYAPDVPTLVELGVRGVDTPTWQAVFAPPKTDTAIVSRLSRDIGNALRDADTASKLQQQGIIVSGEDSATLSKVINDDFSAWQTFVRENDVPIE